MLGRPAGLLSVYGALSRPEGRLEARWRVIAAPGGQRLPRVAWQESGVPVPSPGEGEPPRKGSAGS
ncbi:hypothetical protein QA634_20625 [Methylobacterium sp. CB376]|uniref:hypothetical protein n=1 Tax=unclassified Methylobacterium TaxID=2615210 RepID=UPI00031C93CA|nr:MULTISPECIES: hypothetical protein [Methylobacterium]WFT77709.1 hypothetical protein QA634_20625 [Methylobacterium nodulans]